MILYNYRIYGVLKQPLGKTIKGKEYSAIPQFVGLGREMVKMASFYYQI